MPEQKNNIAENAPVPTTALSKDEMVLTRLEHMEALLANQHNMQKKTLFHQRVSTLLLLALVVVIGVGLYHLTGTLQTAMNDLPQLIQHTDELVQQVNAVDFDTLNSSLDSLDKGLSQVDFSALNNSVENLSRVTQALSDVVGFFGN